MESLDKILLNVFIIDYNEEKPLTGIPKVICKSGCINSKIEYENGLILTEFDVMIIKCGEKDSIKIESWEIKKSNNYYPVRQLLKQLGTYVEGILRGLILYYDKDKKFIIDSNEKIFIEHYLVNGRTESEIYQSIKNGGYLDLNKKLVFYIEYDPNLGYHIRYFDRRDNKKDISVSNGLKYLHS